MKVIDHKSIPEDRLSTTDEKGWRVYLFPAAVQGFWRKRRTVVQVFLIAIFLLGPWITVGGEQLLLLDIPNRKFSIFGLTFWAHDVPILFFVILIATVGLAFVSAIWGRVWCGWACPQTVFIDGVFRRIERWVIGSHLEQMKLAKAPWDKKKFFKISLKWFFFIVCGLIISHSFIAYFVGSKNLWPMITSSPTENWTAFLVMAVITFLIIFDFGWFREQFCIIMCPYGRFQSLLMDKNSLAVMYDNIRGEPRRGKDVKNPGDCVDCFRCVSVCPTGIDIRRGVQMECIACTACIDACDEVMEKVEKPRGLIRYASWNDVNGIKRKVLTPRVYLYVFILAIATFGLIWSISKRQPIDAMILRAKDTPFELIQDSRYRQEMAMNHYKIHLKNHLFENILVSYDLSLEDKNLGIEMVAPINPISLKPGELQRLPIFIRFPTTLTKQKNGQINIKINFSSSGTRNFQIEKEVNVVGPF